MGGPLEVYAEFGPEPFKNSFRGHSLVIAKLELAGAIPQQISINPLGNMSFDLGWDGLGGLLHTLH